jgi:hypothetical protein
MKVFVLYAIVRKNLNDKNRLYCCFTDLKRAFDSVNLNGLFLKLYKLGIGGKALRIIIKALKALEGRLR